jgi:murein DD-endopeptidase MepM/ murein hydrolase activator NlpD
MTRIALITLTICLLLAGCALDRGTPAVTGHSGAPVKPKTEPVPTSERGLRPGTTLVQPGENLGAVAARLGLTTRALIDANGLKAPFKVTPGQVLIVPTPPVYIVQPGDTANSLARRFGLYVSEIVRLNGLQPPYMLKTGQRLTLPAAAPGVMAGAPPRASAPTTSVSPIIPPPSASPPPVTTAQVTPPPPPPTRGPSPSISTETLPPVKAPIITPQAPPVPQAPQSAAQQAPVIETPKPLEIPKPADAPKPVDVQKSVEPPEPVVKEPPLVKEPPVAMAAAPKAQGKFVWPIQSGEVISRFGPKPGGLYNDGVNIAAREGTPVLAAADGTVAYAGKELKGFGNLILIRHANGWISAYAHNESLLVAKGDVVRHGQPIARVGKSGDVERPQLHFELREETDAVDPLLYLPRSGNRPRLG